MKKVVLLTPLYVQNKFDINVPTWQHPGLTYTLLFTQGE